MPKLQNDRWELFAQGIVRGNSKDQAYQDAGYKPNRHNASRLLNTNETIRARIDELQAKVQLQTETTLETVTAALWDTYQDNAGEGGNQSARVSSLATLAKMHGLETDPRKNDREPFAVTVNGFPEMKKSNGRANGHATNGHAGHHDPE